MKPSRFVLWALVLAVAGVIVWRVGFHGSEPYLLSVEQQAGAQPNPAAPGPNEPAGQAGDGGSEPSTSPDAGAPAEPNGPEAGATPSQPDDPNRPAPAERPGTPNGSAPPRAGTGPEPAEPNAPGDPNEPLEAVNLKDVEMKNIIEKIAQWTGKTVIPAEEVMKQKITIYAPQKLPRKKALEKIYTALLMKSYVVEEVGDTILLKPLADAKLGVYPTVSPDEPLAMFESREQIVRKFFRLTNYPPAQMGEIVRPLVAEYGHVSVDETTGTLLVIDTVANLMSIQQVIDQFDVPGAGQTITDVIPIEYGDPAEIVQLLRMLLGETPIGDSRNRRSYGGRSSYTPRLGGPVSRSPSSRPTPSKSGGATSIVIGRSQIPLILIPDPRRKWIIASGSAEDVEKIHEWIKKLDIEEPVRSEYETIPISYADPREVAERIEDALGDMPGTELRPSVVIQPVEQSRQIIIFGRADLRDMVKALITKIDVPAGTFETKHFVLKNADPQQIKDNLDNLYGETVPRYDYYSYYRYGPGRSRGPADTVKVIAFPTMQQVTVIASPENMRKVEKQIEEWDVPLDVDAVKPRIVELQNSDPVQMAELLTKLFTEDQDLSRTFTRMYFYGESEDQRSKIVGPLYGQLTFEDVPGTKKIIVISKIPQAYDVIEQLILELDRQEMAEIPNVVQLKYADPEDLAERLNAMFNEPGTTAPIRRSDRGLSDYSMDNSQGNQNQNQGNNRSEGGQGAAGEYMPWWSRATRSRLDEEPISNVIGRVRFIPDPRSKSILVLAPPEFQESIKKMITALDIPGKQVMVKAVVIEVDHQDLTSLGVQLSSNAAGVFDVGENAVTALSQLAYLDERGSATITGEFGVTALVDFLRKQVNAQILNQQTLWTEDNEEASFFKGQEVGFQTSASTSETGGRVTQSFEYKQIGMTLAVRPSITPEKNVDMMVTVLLSNLTGDSINGQPVTRVMRTTTNMIVADGQTLMLGGILFQTDSKVMRKVPLFGDVPLVGGLFRHNNVVKTNNELIIFITPYVVGEGLELPEGTVQELEKPRERLGQVQSELSEMSEQLEGDLNE